MSTIESTMTFFKCSHSALKQKSQNYSKCWPFLTFIYPKIFTLKGVGVRGTKGTVLFGVKFRRSFFGRPRSAGLMVFWGRRGVAFAQSIFSFSAKEARFRGDARRCRGVEEESGALIK